MNAFRRITTAACLGLVVTGAFAGSAQAVTGGGDNVVPPGDFAQVPAEVLQYTGTYLGTGDLARLSGTSTAMRDLFQSQLDAAKHQERLCGPCAQGADQSGGDLTTCSGCGQQASMKQRLSVGKHGQRYSCGHVVHVHCSM